MLDYMSPGRGGTCGGACILQMLLTISTCTESTGGQLNVETSFSNDTVMVARYLRTKVHAQT